ncbi:NUDIX hydrolase domain-like protein [Trichoderma barbatum]
MMSLKTIGAKQLETTYICRYAVRVVALKPLKEIAIIYVDKGNYYKLPGGGIKRDEEHLNAARRKVQEETGAIISLRNTNCIATTEELHNNLYQISYCYLADILDATGSPSLTEEERADGLSHQWMPINKALEAIVLVKPTSELGRYIHKRDVYLLTEAKKVLEGGYEQKVLGTDLILAVGG